MRCGVQDMFIERVKALMEERGINKHELAVGSGIPYTTVDGWFKKGSDNVRLGTLLRLAEYFIYRHFASAPDEYEAGLRLQFAFLSTKLICALDSIFHDAESTRLYSSEIEYSDENVEKILDYIDENIPVE